MQRLWRYWHTLTRLLGRRASAAMAWVRRLRAMSRAELWQSAKQAWRLWALALLVVLALGAVTYRYISTTDFGDITEGNINKTSVARQVPPGFFEYRTQAYHFSILFPQEMRVKEYGGKGDSLTVTFDEGQPLSFQIFATPYNKQAVDGERFAKDNPSRMYAEPLDVVVAGERAVIFFSQAPGVGQTREVWFIRRGVLYEVNTKKENDEWLSKTMSSWMFVD